MAYIIERPEKDLVTLRDSKYGDEEAHPDFVGPSPVHKFSLAGWVQLCQLRWFLDVGMGAGLKSGKYVRSIDTVVERQGPDHFVWHTTEDSKLPTLEFTLVEHEAFILAMESGRIKPVELDEGELDVYHKVVCAPPSREVIDLETLWDEPPHEREV